MKILSLENLVTFYLTASSSADYVGLLLLSLK